MANVWAVSCGTVNEWRSLWPNWSQNEYVAIGYGVDFSLVDKEGNRLTYEKIASNLIERLDDPRLRNEQLVNIIRKNYRKEFSYNDGVNDDAANEYINNFITTTGLNVVGGIQNKIKEINRVRDDIKHIYSSVKCIELFAFVALENDYVVVKNGNNGVLGIAQIIGKIGYSEQAMFPGHHLRAFRKVRWIATLEHRQNIDINKNFIRPAIQRLLVECDVADITIMTSGDNDYRQRMNTILEAFGLLDANNSETTQETNMHTKSTISPLNKILFGPPGTGKTYNTVNKAIAIANPSFKENDNTRKQIKTEFDELIKSGQVVFTTFHQSMSYEDFIEGIKPLKPVVGDTFVKYEVQSGIFKKICDNADKDKDKNFVLIIDEINRGNVSQIFGELITLIEDDKRIGKDEALKVTLPYSKEEFGVPSNLYIIGTMNTADRSVEALDAALRRRFSFEEMPPKPDLISSAGKLSETKGILKSDELDDIDLPLLLKKINERLEKLLDKDHQIGHSYFISVKDLDGLKLAFQNKIIPLLQEYFFGDYGKIGLVLGKGFVSKDDSKKNNFADFSDADADEFSERPIFKIPPLTSDDAFIEAINSLLNN